MRCAQELITLLWREECVAFLWFAISEYSLKRLNEKWRKIWETDALRFFSSFYLFSSLKLIPNLAPSIDVFFRYLLASHQFVEYYNYYVRLYNFFLFSGDIVNGLSSRIKFKCFSFEYFFILFFKYFKKYKKMVNCF